MSRPDKTAVYLNNGIIQSCQICREDIAYRDIAEQMNHYIDNHGYKIRHVGEETFESNLGLEHRTVAILTLEK